MVNRTIEKAELIKQSFNEINVTTYDGLSAEERRFDVIVNATSLSLNGELPRINESMYGNVLAYDLMYGKTGTTVFTDYALANGALEVSDGLGMLVGQAALSFNLWRGVTPDPDPVLKALRNQL